MAGLRSSKAFIARGGVQSAFQQFLVGPHRTAAAIFLANLMFSITHIHLSTSIALLVFVPGLFWGWLYSRHKTLIGVCISHFIVGTFSFYVVGFQNLLRSAGKIGFLWGRQQL